MKSKKAKSKISHYNFFIKNRRGFLLAEETVKIVIAVIAISFLIYFLTSLYLKSQESKDLELAKASLEHLVSEISLEHKSVDIYNPVKGRAQKKWLLESWPHNGIRPKYCSNLGWENCICICKWGGDKTLGTSWSPQGYADDCDAMGTCLKNDKQLTVESGDTQTIELKKPAPIKLTIDYKGKTIK